MTVAYAPQTRTMRTDQHSASDQLIDLVVSVPNNELNFLMLNTATPLVSNSSDLGGVAQAEASEAIFSHKFEQVVR